MGGDETTTIRVREQTRGRLEKLKIHPNQSFDELLNTLLDLLKKYRVPRNGRILEVDA